VAGRGNFQAGAAGELGLRNIPSNVDAEETEEIAAIHEPFVRHHRIKEEGMRGAVARFRLDHPEFLRP
jgi:hypothetical protein